MSLPPDIFSRAAGEAIRRVALVTLDGAVATASELASGRDGSRERLDAWLRRFDAQVRVLGPRFGLADATKALDGAHLDEADPISIGREVSRWAERTRPAVATISVTLDEASGDPSYGAVVAGKLRWATATLVAALEDRAVAVEAPAEDDVREAASLVGDLLFPLGACDEAATTDALAEARAHIDALVASPSPTEANVEALRLVMERIARSLEARTEREVEYKYLLRAFPPHAADAQHEELAQGYVPGERLHERLRRVDARGAVRYLRTVKIGSGLARMEIEEETTERVFRTMWPLTEGCRIHKERYSVEDGALTWTIDRFVDRDLVLAEVEVPSTEVAPSPPAWLAEYIVRDVTDDPAYVNLNLAR